MMRAHKGLVLMINYGRLNWEYLFLVKLLLFRIVYYLFIIDDR